MNATAMLESPEDPRNVDAEATPADGRDDGHELLFASNRRAREILIEICDINRSFMRARVARSPRLSAMLS